MAVVSGGRMVRREIFSCVSEGGLVIVYRDNHFIRGGGRTGSSMRLRVLEMVMI